MKLNIVKVEHSDGTMVYYNLNSITKAEKYKTGEVNAKDAVKLFFGSNDTVEFGSDTVEFDMIIDWLENEDE